MKITYILFIIQIYHLYLYTVSLLYLGIVYSRLLKQRTVDTVIKKEVGESCEAQTLSVDKPTNRLHLRYGSFYLRMGAIGKNCFQNLFLNLKKC